MKEYCAICKNIKCRCDGCDMIDEYFSDGQFLWYCNEYDDLCENIDMCMCYYEESVCTNGCFIGSDK